MSSDIRKVCMQRICFLLLMIKKEYMKWKDKEGITVVKYGLKRCKEEMFWRSHTLASPKLHKYSG